MPFQFDFALDERQGAARRSSPNGWPRNPLQAGCSRAMSQNSLAGGAPRGCCEIVAATHAGMTTGEFEQT